jgi:hypothetical protein
MDFIKTYEESNYQILIQLSEIPLVESKYGKENILWIIASYLYSCYVIPQGQMMH